MAAIKFEIGSSDHAPDAEVAADTNPGEICAAWNGAGAVGHGSSSIASIPEAGDAHGDPDAGDHESDPPLTKLSALPEEPELEIEADASAARQDDHEPSPIDKPAEDISRNHHIFRTPADPPGMADEEANQVLHDGTSAPVANTRSSIRSSATKKNAREAGIVAAAWKPHDKFHFDLCNSGLKRDGY